MRSINFKPTEVMSEFEENNPKRLKEFLTKLNELVDEYHPNIYTIDGVFRGAMDIEIAILDRLNK
jgi:Holliday junction resolvasome RuvABC endonuclease subunit